MSCSFRCEGTGKGAQYAASMKLLAVRINSDTMPATKEVTTPNSGWYVTSFKLTYTVLHNQRAMKKKHLQDTHIEASP